jgi:hypothetical protein
MGKLQSQGYSYPYEIEVIVFWNAGGSLHVCKLSQQPVHILIIAHNQTDGNEIFWWKRNNKFTIGVTMVSFPPENT